MHSDTIKGFKKILNVLMKDEAINCRGIYHETKSIDYTLRRKTEFIKSFN